MNAKQKQLNKVLFRSIIITLAAILMCIPLAVTSSAIIYDNGTGHALSGAGTSDTAKAGYNSAKYGGYRFAIVIQNNKGNKHSSTTIVAPITTKRVPNRLPVHVFTFAGQTGLPQNSAILLEQIRILDKSRIKDFVGMVNKFTMDEVDRALKISVGLNSKYN